MNLIEHKYIPNKLNKSNYDSFRGATLGDKSEEEKHQVYKRKGLHQHVYKTKRYKDKRIRKTRKNNVVRRMIEKIF